MLLQLQLVAVEARSELEVRKGRVGLLDEPPPLFFARGSLLTLKHGKKVGGLLAISSN